MAPSRRKVVASRHLVCGNCRSWIQFESSGCGKIGRTLEVEFCVYVQGVYIGDGFGETSGRAEAYAGKHDGEGCRTAI